MDSLGTNKFQTKIVVVAGGILVILVVFFTVVSSLGKKSTSSTTSQTDQSSPFGGTSPTPTYVPPQNFTYSTVDSVNFLPHSINDFTVDQQKLQTSALQVYPNLTGKDLQDTINQTVFYWLALNEYYQTIDASQVSYLYTTKKIADFVTIQKDLQKLQAAYQPNVMSLDGLYLKVRFRGTLKSNIAKLNQTEAGLQSLAQTVIARYHDQLAQAGDKNQVLKSFNNDNTVMLLNNRETGKTFSSYQLFPPLFGDDHYYDLIRSVPTGQVSDILTLKSKLNGDLQSQDYAYLVLYISKKTGTLLPIDALANMYVSKAKIR